MYTSYCMASSSASHRATRGESHDDDRIVVCRAAGGDCRTNLDRKKLVYFVAWSGEVKQFVLYERALCGEVDLIGQRLVHHQGIPCILKPS